MNAESHVTANVHAWFGGGWLETQVKLCAGRLPYWVIGVCGPRSLTEQIKEEVKAFLAEHLRLTVSENKTRITNGRNGQAKFLGAHA